MGFEPPVGAGVHAGGGEGAQHAQLLAARLDILGYGLERFKIVDLVGGLNHRAVQRHILVQEGAVVDEAVRLDHIRDSQHLPVLDEGEVIAFEVAVERGIAQVQAIVPPGFQAHGAVDLKQRGRIRLLHLGPQGVLIGAGGGGHHRDGHAGLLRVGLGQRLPLLGLFGLEVEVVDRAGSGDRGRGRLRRRIRCGRLGNGRILGHAENGDRPYHQQGNGQYGKQFLHKSPHSFSSCAGSCADTWNDRRVLRPSACTVSIKNMRGRDAASYVFHKKSTKHLTTSTMNGMIWA